MDQTFSGYHIGKYELRDWIGRSRIGTVFQALDTVLDRIVAFTLLSARLTSDPGFLPYLTRRMEGQARLQHPHILGIYELGQAGGHHYLATEYVAGVPLAQLLEQLGAMHPDQAYPILRHLAEALDYSHSAGWVYGDLGPDNIIIGPNGRTLLADREVLWNAVETAPGDLELSAYTAPERVTGGQTGPWSDRYALGVIAYQMLSGHAPFQGQSTAALLYQVTQEPPPPIRAEQPDLPEEVDRVIGRALAKEPGQRYESTAQFVDALGAALAGLLVSVAVPPTPPPAAALPTSQEVESWIPAHLQGIAGQEMPATPPAGEAPAPAAAGEEVTLPAGEESLGTTAAPFPDIAGPLTPAVDTAVPLPAKTAPAAFPSWAEPAPTWPVALDSSEGPTPLPEMEPFPALAGVPAPIPEPVPGAPSPTRGLRPTTAVPPQKKATGGASVWLWILLAFEVLALLIGLVLLILALRGAL